MAVATALRTPRTITASYNLSPIRSSIYQNKTATRSAPQSQFKTAIKPELRVINNSARSSGFDAKFVLLMISASIVTFVTILLINIWVSSISIEAVDVQQQITQTRQDTQAIKVAMEQKGTAIADRAKAMGMVARDKTMTIRISQNHITTPENAANVTPYPTAGTGQ